MSVIFKSQDQVPAAVGANVTNKGFADTSPTPGGTYVVQPPKPYQNLFQGLQKRIEESNLPIALVRIPHVTVIAAKVVDQKPTQSWKDLTKVQATYQAFLLYHLNEKMKEIPDYKTAVKEVLIAHEATLAKIAATANQQDALSQIKDRGVQEAIRTRMEKGFDYDGIKQAALASVNETSFDLNISNVSLTSNGSIIFQLSENEKMLQMRLDLIIAGQAISKWPQLSVMKNGWSTIGYTVKVIDETEKRKVEAVIGAWVDENRSALENVRVACDVDSLGCIAMRSNDFHAVKRVVFPMATKVKERPDPIEIPAHDLSLEDLRMTPRAGEEGPTPIAGGRSIQYYGNEIWDGPIDQEVHGDVSYATPSE